MDLKVRKSSEKEAGEPSPGQLLSKERVIGRRSKAGSESHLLLFPVGEERR